MKLQSLIILSQKRNLDPKSVKEIINKVLSVKSSIKPEDFFLVTEGNKNSIGVKDIEGLNEWAFGKHEGIRVILINQAEKLTEEAQNSLLKLIEEPPENIICCLITLNLDLILETIKSRCIIYSTNFNKEEPALKKLANTFLRSNYLEREEIIDRISSNEELKREEIAEFIEELVRCLEGSKRIEVLLPKLIKALKGIKRGTNVKLTLDYISSLF